MSVGEYFDYQPHAALYPWGATISCSTSQSTDKEGASCDLLDLMRFSAIALFVDRAQAVNPGLVLGLKNSRTISAICMHLDGLPLAIELAAARVNFLSPQVLLEQISENIYSIRMDCGMLLKGIVPCIMPSIGVMRCLLWNSSCCYLDWRLNNGGTLSAAEKSISDKHYPSRLSC